MDIESSFKFGYELTFFETWMEKMIRAVHHFRFRIIIIIVRTRDHNPQQFRWLLDDGKDKVRDRLWGSSIYAYWQEAVLSPFFIMRQAKKSEQTLAQAQPEATSLVSGVTCNR
jgi:arabinogalactan endo-1,4-beta-galactosidase